MQTLHQLSRTEALALYEFQRSPSGPSVRTFVASTPETRAICNDPFVLGVKYTRSLSKGCERVLRSLQTNSITALDEKTTTVLHILRGGLNFGLRDALCDGCGFNVHSSAFISAQRARQTANPSEWYITEGTYQKVQLGGVFDVIFGDVVATGTSLEHALHQIAEIASKQGGQIRSLVFFTIGGPRSHELIESVSARLSSTFPLFSEAFVIYFEGVFSMATEKTPVSIRIDGTDLLRRDAILAPEFLESQYESPAYPLERCTIYDAGSRAFDIPEYLEDVHDYWRQTLALGLGGFSFEKLLAERMPGLDVRRFGAPNLADIAQKQLDRCASYQQQ